MSEANQGRECKHTKLKQDKCTTKQGDSGDVGERSGFEKINQESKLNKSSTDNSIMFSVLTISVSYIGIPAFGS